MKKRNQHFEKKYKKALNTSNFFVYIYTSKTKSNLDLILNRELYLIKLKKLSLPSAFKLEKTHKTQGPIIIIIHGQNLNFAKLNYLEKCKVLGIKVNNLMYSHSLIKDVLFYKNSANLCYALSTNLLNKLLSFALLSSMPNK